MKKLQIGKSMIWKLLIGVGVLLAAGLVFLIFALNNREEPVQPEEQEDLVIAVNSEEEERGDLVDAVMQTKQTDTYHGPIVPVCVYKQDELPRIVCWGDSLTEASDGHAYPDVLGTLTDAKIINYGLHSDSTRAIAVREGATPIYASECVIPGEVAPVAIRVTFAGGKSAQILRNGSVGVNPCMLGGVPGTLSLTGSGYTFIRSKAGSPVAIAGGTRISTQASMNRSSKDIVILFSGANDGLDASKAEELIENQQRILDDIGSPHYVVIGLTYADESDDLDEINEEMAKSYGEHFLDIRDYFLSYGLADAGITPTAQDEKDIKAGIIPDSLRQDHVHGTPDFYREIAEQVYRKLMYLGYLPLDPVYAADDFGVQRVVFWGDSLTEGTGGEGVTIPNVVQECAKKDDKEITVRNYGVYSEKSSLIAARAGGNPMRLDKKITIPADTEPVEIVPVSDMAGHEMLLVFGGDKELSARGEYDGDNSVNPCILAGVEGNVSIDPKDGTRYFTRLKPGKEVTAKVGEQLEFFAMRDKRKSDILVIWNGSNDDLTPENVKDTFAYIHSIVDFTGTDRYIVLNMIKTGAIPQILEVNEAFEEEFGEHLLDIYSYMMGPAFEDAGVEPTDEDKSEMAKKRMPASFCIDSSHFNSTGYTLIGKQVYQKLCELGYL
ncbi:MAG: SGNH/GDSL hydrolase family protein [Lachnospiraceae bacterium]|nr:SGNH/GDSL hydrolase family protein [Lachnospiraceae bacterium]